MSWRHALETDTALVTATVLHTVGAIGVVAALVVLLVWYRRLRSGDAAPALRTASYWLTLVSVLSNLTGGFMRTYLPGHPGLTDLSTSPWVQVMVLKHAFIFAALGALVYLDRVAAPRLLRLARQGALPAATPRGLAVGAWLVATGVLGASVLGGMAQIAPLDDTEVDGDLPGLTAAEAARAHHLNATGSLTSVGPLTDTAEGTFDVPGEARLMTAVLVWSDPVAGLTLCIASADGRAEACSGGSGGRADAGFEWPSQGAWTYTVRGDNAVGVAFDLSIRMAPALADETLLVETVTVAPGTFFEINTEMPPNATFHWDWTASESLHFNVHSHFDDEVQDHVDKDADADRDSFTNDREGGYSFLWEPTGSTPVSLTYRIWGEFEVDSYFPPR